MKHQHLNKLSRFTIMKAIIAASLFILLQTSAHAEETLIIKAVGTWGYFTNYQKHEGPFWNKQIAKATNGSIIGEISPQSHLELSGSEIMRLVKKGVFDFAFGLPAYVSPENAIFEGADLSSLVQDIQTQRKVAKAYFPTLERAFEQKYNAKLMNLYPFPSQMIWCKNSVDNIDDLKGRRIRVYLTTLSDFVESVGAIPVNVTYNDVPKALEQNKIDCVITGTMSAYSTELYRDTPYGFTLRVGWGLAFGAINIHKWNLMSNKQQQILQRELADLTDRMWLETNKEDKIALACLTNAPCSIGDNGRMTLTEPSVQDLITRDKLVHDVILPRWAARCGPECAANWNRTVGKLLKMRANIDVE